MWNSFVYHHGYHFRKKKAKMTPRQRLFSLSLLLTASLQVATQAMQPRRVELWKCRVQHLRQFYSTEKHKQRGRARPTAYSSDFRYFPVVLIVWVIVMGSSILLGDNIDTVLSVLGSIDLLKIYSAYDFDNVPMMIIFVALFVNDGLFSCALKLKTLTGFDSEASNECSMSGLCDEEGSSVNSSGSIKVTGGTKSNSGPAQNLTLEEDYSDKDPIKITDKKCQTCCGKSYSRNFRDESYGKWGFRKNFEDLYGTWRVIRAKVLSGELGATGAECSTLFYDPLRSGLGPITTGIIAVYTKEENIMDVGLKLIHLPVVQHDIWYKTQKVTKAGQYTYRKEFNPIESKLYWNDGSPSVDLAGEEKPANARRNHDDHPKWKLHIVKGVEKYSSIHSYGKWIVRSNYERESDENITTLWHTLKREVESGNIPASMMECPALKRKNDLPEIHVHSSKEKMEEVGMRLVSCCKMSITRSDDSRILFWNSGNPIYSNETTDSTQGFSPEPMDSTLDQSDLALIKPYVKKLQKNGVVDVGVSLGLDYTRLSDVGEDRIHNEMITRWLGKQDHVEKITGTPTWRKLAKALRDNGFGEVANDVECLKHQSSGGVISDVESKCHPGIIFHEDSVQAIITSEGSDVHTKDGGITVSIPNGALKKEEGEVRLQIKKVKEGNFKIPDNFELASSVYLVEPSRKVHLEKAVTVRMKYNARVSAGDCNKLVFMSASSTPQFEQSGPVYVFSEITQSKGIFKPGLGIW